MPAVSCFNALSFAVTFDRSFCFCISSLFFFFTVLIWLFYCMGTSPFVFFLSCLLEQHEYLYLFTIIVFFFFYLGSRIVHECVFFFLYRCCYSVRRLLLHHNAHAQAQACVKSTKQQLKSDSNINSQCRLKKKKNQDLRRRQFSFHLLMLLGNPGRNQDKAQSLVKFFFFLFTSSFGCAEIACCDPLKLTSQGVEGGGYAKATEASFFFPLLNFRFVSCVSFIDAPLPLRSLFLVPFFFFYLLPCSYTHTKKRQPKTTLVLLRAFCPFFFFYMDQYSFFFLSFIVAIR